MQVGPDVDDHLDNSHRAKPQIENYCKELGSKGLNWMQVDRSYSWPSHRHLLTTGRSILRPAFFMENFDGFIGAIAVSGLRAGLDKHTTINLVVSPEEMSNGLGPIAPRRVQITDFFQGFRRHWQSCSRCAEGERLFCKGKNEVSR